MTMKNKTLRIAEAARSVFYIPILAGHMKRRYAFEQVVDNDLAEKAKT